jgi:hypothetical protein
VNVSVTTVGGTSTQLVSYTYQPIPTVTSVVPNAGPLAGGNIVTITGTGFVTGATTVNFGTGTGTSVSVGSPTSLTATVPAGTGTVNVSVTTVGGTSAGLVSYAYDQIPTVTTVTPTTGPQAGAQPVTITGTGFVIGSTTVNFGANAGTAVMVSSSTTLTAVAPAGTGTVRVTVTTPGGTSTTGPNYAYVSGPFIFGVSPTSGPAAGGTSVTITGAGFLGATGVLFGLVGATFVVNSNTSITVTTPAELPSTVNVAVVVGPATSNTVPYTFM